MKSHKSLTLTGTENGAPPILRILSFQVVHFTGARSAELRLDCTPMIGQIRLGESGGVGH